MANISGILGNLFSQENAPALLGAAAGLLGGGGTREQISRGLLGILQGQQLGSRLKSNQLQQQVYATRLAEADRQNAARQRAATALGPLADVADAYPNIAARMFAAQNPEATADPSAVREYQYFQKLSPADQQRYLAVKRAQQNVNVGDAVIQPDPLNPGRTMGQFQVGAPPKQEIQDDRIVTAPGVVPAQRGGLSRGGAFSGASSNSSGIIDLPKSPMQLERDAKQANIKAGEGAIITDEINGAIDLIDKNPMLTTGLGGAALRNIPTTHAFSLAKKLDTLKANIGFSKLQQMREASPTGGALGQVSDFENKNLQATFGSLEQSQNAKELRYNLQRFHNVWADVVHGRGKGPSRFPGVPGLPDEKGDAAPRAPASISNEDLLNKYAPRQ